MCIRDSFKITYAPGHLTRAEVEQVNFSYMDINEALRRYPCLLYTSDAADERSSVDLGGRRIIKKKKVRRRRGRCVIEL